MISAKEVSITVPVTSAVCATVLLALCKKRWFARWDGFHPSSAWSLESICLLKGRCACAAGVQMNGGDYTFLQRANKTFTECIQNTVQQTGLSAPSKSPLYAGGSLEEQWSVLAKVELCLYLLHVLLLPCVPVLTFSCIFPRHLTLFCNTFL